MCVYNSSMCLQLCIIFIGWVLSCIQSYQFFSTHTLLFVVVWCLLVNSYLSGLTVSLLRQSRPRQEARRTGAGLDPSGSRLSGVHVRDMSVKS